MTSSEPVDVGIKDQVRWLRLRAVALCRAFNTDGLNVLRVNIHRTTTGDSGLIRK